MLTNRITRVFTEAGFQTNEARQGRQRKAVIFGAHSLRHHFVTAATEVGFPAKMIRTITGHATDDMLGHYQQIGKGLATELAARIGSTPQRLLAQGPEPAGNGTNAGAISDKSGDAGIEPLPAWAKIRIRNLAELLSAKTWQTIKTELEDIGAK